MDDKPDFKIGDIVKLKSGRAYWTVVSVDPLGVHCICETSDSNGQFIDLKSRTFVREVLVKVT
jgi:hypothetical protein